jgi:hypothetical protein
MSGVNATIEVGVQVGHRRGGDGELFSEPNQPRAITRLAKQLADLLVREC